MSHPNRQTVRRLLRREIPGDAEPSGAMIVALVSLLALATAAAGGATEEVAFRLEQGGTRLTASSASGGRVAATRTFYRGDEIVAVDEALTENGGTVLATSAAALEGEPDGEYRVVIDAQSELRNGDGESGESLAGRTVLALRLVDGEIFVEGPADAPPRPKGAVIGVPDPDAAPYTGQEPEDPSVSETYPCYYIHNLTWNYPDGQPAVEGQVRWPSLTCDPSDGPPTGRPVLVFAHGLGMDHEDHTYLMRHLALNGIVAASIANSGDNENRGEQMVSYLNGLTAYWTWSGRLGGRVAFAGHSRGGEGAVTAARLVAEGLGAFAYDVRAVVSIAPTDGGGSNGPDPHEDLTGAMADGYLAIYGSHDLDVQGSLAIAANAEPQETAFAIYDRAGAEFSSEGFQILGIHVDKSFVFLIGAGHGDFKNLGFSIGNGTEEGQATAKAYFNAFLRWQIWDQDHFRGFFDGAWRPDAIESSDVVQQFSAGLRRVVDDFENGDDGVSRIGGSVAHSDPITFLEGPLHQTIASSPHETGGLRITWAGAETVRWNIPNLAPFGVGPLRDVSGFTHLSLRVAQVYGNAFNTEGADQDFHARLSSGAGLSNKVRIGAYGRLPYPDEFICNSVLDECVGDYSKSAMATIRVPLTAFKNVDWTDVRNVYLYFDVDGHDSGAIAIDSLEFTDGPVNGATIFADGFESGDLVAWGP